MFADDHAPPHVHLLFPDGAALIDIMTLEIVRGAAPASLAREARSWLVENRVAVLARWRVLNERE